MKLLAVFPLLLLTSCGMFETRVQEPQAPLTITEKLEKCVHSRIQDGVKPLEALKICDTIFRGRE